MKKLVSVDIDGTLRNIEGPIGFYIEQDFSDELCALYEELAVDVENPHTPFSLSRFFDDPRVDADFQDWLYFKRSFHIFGQAKRMHKNVVDHVNSLQILLRDTHDVVYTSVQKNSSIIATMHWLSINGAKPRNIKFFDSFAEKSEWILENAVDVVIDDSPMIVEDLLRTDQFQYWGPDYPKIFVPKWNYTQKYDGNVAIMMIDVFKNGLSEVLDYFEKDVTHE